MPIRPDEGYVPRTKEQIKENYVQKAQSLLGDKDYINSSVIDTLFETFAETVSQNQEESLQNTYDAAYIKTATGQELTWKCEEKNVYRRPAIAATGVVEFSRDTQPPSEIVIPEGTTVQTFGDDPVSFVTTEGTSIGTDETTATANIMAEEGGEEGNVASGTITVIPSPPADLEVTNPNPTGDDDYTLTDGRTQTLGLDEESDEELRERALSTDSFGGVGTVSDFEREITSLDGQPSITVYTNRQTVADANGNGLPPVSTELLIYTQSLTNAEIGEAIYDVLTPTERLSSGNVGNSVTYTVTETVLNDDRVVEWSTPIETTLAIDVTVVHDDAYAGDDAVKNAIVEYVGGSDTEGAPVDGVDPSESVIVDELERRVSGLNGIIGVSSVTIDADGDGTDDITTNVDGLAAYEVANNEVVTVDAFNGDVTVSTTET